MVSDVGPLLTHWRSARRLSQLALAAEAAVSIRHLCFLETGRAKPSRAMVLKLAEVLDVPFRERNTMLLKAGFAPECPESELDAVRRFLAPDGQPKTAPGPANVLRRMFHPDGVRRHVTNWPEVAEALVRRARREAIGLVTDERAQRILDEVLACPGVPASLRSLDPETPVPPIVPIRHARGDRRFDYFSTVTTLGTPQDVTQQELRIECFFPITTKPGARASVGRDCA
ncbi:LOW QUALITY PROTEIN: toxin-antitoxin system, antitoxin component, Xre family, partial [Kutzneria sp. 744]